MEIMEKAVGVGWARSNELPARYAINQRSVSLGWGRRIGRIEMRLTGKRLSATSDIKEDGLGIVV